MINLFISRNLIVQKKPRRKMQLWKSTGYQYQVTLVVMITQLREGEPPNQRTKAEQYWPDRCAFLSICLIRYLFCQLVLQVVKLSSFLFLSVCFSCFCFLFTSRRRKKIKLCTWSSCHPLKVMSLLQNALSDCFFLSPIFLSDKYNSLFAAKMTRKWLRLSPFWED